MSETLNNATAAPATSEADQLNGRHGEKVPQAEAPRQQTVSQVPIPPYEKLANPGPLGLIGFAITTFVLGLYECGAG